MICFVDINLSSCFQKKKKNYRYINIFPVSFEVKLLNLSIENQIRSNSTIQREMPYF